MNTIRNLVLPGIILVFGLGLFQAWHESEQMKMESARQSMSNLMQDLVRVKETKGVEFLLQSYKFMPETFAYGNDCVMRYEVGEGWKDQSRILAGDFSNLHPDCIRITIWAYPNIYGAQTQNGRFASMSKIIADLK